jgi:lactoylglutathione lyase
MTGENDLFWEQQTLAARLYKSWAAATNATFGAMGGFAFGPETKMEFLHTMVRVTDLDQSLDFYCNKLGLVEVRRQDSEKGRFTLVFLSAPGDVEHAQKDQAPLIELTFNWDVEPYSSGRNFGHLAYRVDDIYATCEKLQAGGVTINRPPRDGYMAFIRSPDNVSIELLQKGEPKTPREPWASMQNTGTW